MNKVWLVTKETYRRQVISWSFLFLVLSPFIFGLFGLLGGVLAGQSSNNSVAIVSTIPNTQQAFEKLDGFSTKYKTESSVQKAVKNEKVEGYILVTEQNGQLSATYHGTKSLSQIDEQSFKARLAALQHKANLVQAKIQPNQLKILSIQPKFQQKISAEKINAKNKDIRMGSLLILIFLMYILLVTYAAITAQDVATEKGTKIMEVIFSSMPANQYFYGKIIGLISVIFTQVVVYVIGFAGFYYGAPQIPRVASFWNQSKPIINSILQNIVSWSLLFVILGLILFIITAAICGAVVARVEDANKAVQPVMYVIMAGFFLALYASNNPDNIIVRVLSYIPYLSSFLMPVRVISGTATMTEMFISLAILIVSMILIIGGMSRVYSALILQTDDVGFFKAIKQALKFN